MLNALIAIMTNTYEKVDQSKDMKMYREKLDLILEYEIIASFKNELIRRSKLFYIKRKV